MRRPILLALLLGALLGFAPGPAGAAVGVNGKIVFVSTRSGNAEIYSANADGSGVTRLTTTTGWDESGPAVSPDGSRIAYVALGNIFVMNVDGSGPQRLTATAGTDSDPSWSPDGLRLAFSRYDPAGLKTLIWVMNSDGTMARSVSHENADTAPSWSPDGTFIAYTVYLNPSVAVTPNGIWEVAPDGPLSGEVLGGDTVDQPQWSPDSQQLLYECAGAVCETGKGYQLATSPVSGADPQWSPDGAKILYTSGGDVYSANADGGGPTQLTFTGNNTAGSWVPTLANTRPPRVTGATTVGTTLVGDSGAWVGGSGLSYAYQWKRCDTFNKNCQSIEGETSATYTLSSSDIYGTIRLAVTATGSTGTATAFSPGIGSIAYPDAPALPQILGNLSIGTVLTATTGSVGSKLGTAPITYSYQWQRCDQNGLSCSGVSGATNVAYTLTLADQLSTLRFTVTGTNSSGSAVLTSLQTAVVGLAPTNTALPTITGIPIVGTTLVAFQGIWAGGASLLYTYQWKRCDALGSGCVAILLGTNTSYVVGTADQGMTLVVTVTAANTSSAAAATSLPTTVVGSNAAPMNTILPSIAGTPTIGATLNAVKGTWTGGTGIVYTYQWKHCDASGANCSAIPFSTTDTYTVLATDAGARLRVEITATSTSGIATATAPATAIAGASATAASPAGVGAPGSTVEPTVLGPTVVGATLTTSLGAFAGTPPLTYGYVWLRCNASGSACVPVEGATANRYTLKLADVGKTFRVLVTASNGAGVASSTSDVTSVVTVKAPRTTGPVTHAKPKRKVVKKTKAVKAAPKRVQHR